MKLFEKVITVQPDDLDDQQHVNNVRYVQWVQDVAAAHWQQVADASMLAAHAWVVVRHEIDYRRSALLGDVLEIKTWVGHSEGVRSERHVEIYHQDRKELIAKAKTTWCLLDAGTRRPRPVEKVIAVFQ